MNAAVCAVGHVDAAVPIEREIEGFPGVRQQWIGAFVRGGGGCQMTAQHEAVQGEDAHAMIAGIADKEIAGADADAMRIASTVAARCPCRRNRALA